MTEPLHLAPKHTDEDGLVQKKARALLGRNWRTTLAGIGSLICGGVYVASKAMPGHPLLDIAAEVCVGVGLVGGGGGLILAKDKGVSGTAR